MKVLNPYLSIVLLALWTLASVAGSMAADLSGGDCCADLEERVAELEATVARKGNQKMSLTVYGHVNEAILIHDIEDNPRNAVSMIPATHAVSRFGFRGEQKIDAEWAAGFLIEIGLGSFETGRSGPVRDNTLDVRHSALYVRSKALGTVWLGRTSMASDKIAEIDISNSHVASMPLSFAPADNALIGLSTDIFDGKRADAVRWTSASIAGFTLAAAFADEDTYDVALRYAGEFDSVRLAGGVAYRNDSGPFDLGLADTKTIAGSGSVMHVPSGLFAMGAYGNIELPGSLDRIEGWSVRGGVERPIASGVTGTVFGEYGRVTYMDLDAEVIGGGAVVSTGPFALYGSIRHIHDEDVTWGIIGAKVKF